MAFKVSFIKVKKDLKVGRPSYGLLSLILSLFMLTACPAPGPTCVNADDWGQTADITVKIDPKQQYNASGISVLMGAPLKIETSGEVDLCPQSNTVSATVPEVDTATLKKIKPSIKGWQDSGQTVTKGDKLNIVVSGSYNDRNGTQTDGSGLYAYIASEADKNAANGDWWYGINDNNAPSSNRLAMDNNTTCHKSAGDPTKCNPFFELYDNGTTGDNGSGYSGVAPATGKLYFRYARTASSRGMSNSGDGDSRHSPWKGAYRWANHGCEACRLTYIMVLCSGPWFPICYPAWLGTCDGQGYLEKGVLDWSNYKKSKCQEWYPEVVGPAGPGPEYRTGGYWGNDGFDHWVNEYVSNSASSTSTATYNDGPGYTITISHGCPGTFGKYLQMDIGTSTYNITQSTTPSGCTLGSAGCTAVTDNAGQPMYQSQFSVIAASPTSMNSSGVNVDGSVFTPSNPPFTSFGVYDSLVPSTGELWFRVVDDSQASSGVLPSGGNYYSDNLGSYKLHVRTTRVDAGLSGFLNKIITPMRKIIFGYCRQSAALGDNGTASTVVNNLNQTTCPPAATVNQLDSSGNVMSDSKGNPIQISIGWQSGLTQRMYNILVGSGIYIQLVQASLIFMVVIFGIFFMMGLIQDVKEVIIKKVIKFAIIITLISPGSWNFFNVYLFSAFIDGMNVLIAMIAGGFMGIGSGSNNINVVASIDNNPFAFIDGTMSTFFNGNTLIKLMGLIFSSLFGPIYFVIILAGLMMFLWSVLSATILYIICMLALSLLLIVGPIYMIFMLFDRTKNYFDRWIRSLINYTLQPVLVFATLAIFNVFVYSALYTTLHYTVCWKPVYSMALGTLEPLPLFYFYIPDGGHNGESVLSSGMPIAFFMILIFVIIANAMLQFISYMSKLAATLAIGADGAALGDNAAAIMNNIASRMSKKAQQAFSNIRGKN